jgi:hypothetical protein|tara:strand:+ start:9334 stop:9915 length:582 start_codon:yes stop_codon:yes gene_type:complete
MIGAYTQYFQKSKVFLYPLLGIKKGEEFVPVETYISWDGLYTENDYKYIVVYNCDKDLKFKLFEDRVLKSHKLLEFATEIEKDRHIYVFDYSKFNHDFDMFINGRYSKFSTPTKNKVLKYFGSVGKISEYIESFLNPLKYHEVYAEAFEISIETIKEVHEICSKPDLEKETLHEKIPAEVALLKNNSISLDKI